MLVKYTVSSPQEEFECMYCANPVYIGDPAVISNETLNVYCHDSCFYLQERTQKELHEKKQI